MTIRSAGYIFQTQAPMDAFGWSLMKMPRTTSGMPDSIWPLVGHRIVIQADQPPILDGSFPVGGASMANLDDDDANVVVLDIAATATVTGRVWILGRLFSKGIVLQMLLLVVPLHLGVRLHQRGRPIDGRADPADGAGVEIQQKTGQTTTRGHRCHRRETLRLGRCRRRSMRDPVVHEQRHAWIPDQVLRLPGGWIAGHDDGGVIRVGRGR